MAAAANTVADKCGSPAPPSWPKRKGKLAAIPVRDHRRRRTGTAHPGLHESRTRPFTAACCFPPMVGGDGRRVCRPWCATSTGAGCRRRGRHPARPPVSGAASTCLSTTIVCTHQRLPAGLVLLSGPAGDRPDRRTSGDDQTCRAPPDRSVGIPRLTGPGPGAATPSGVAGYLPGSIRFATRRELHDGR